MSHLQSSTVEAESEKEEDDLNNSVRILFEVSMSNLDLRLHFQNKLVEMGTKHFKLGGLDHSDLRLLINSLCFQYHRFANSLDFFQELSREDQDVLLRQNSPCFVQLVFCQAFNSAAGFHQLNNLVAQTIYGGEESSRRILDHTIVKLEFEEFAAMTDMFQLSLIHI